MVLSAYLEGSVSNFIKDTVRLLNTDTEIVLATGGVLNGVKVDQLLRKNVITVIEQIQNGEKLEEQIALIYKGEAIIKAPKKDFYKASKELIKNLKNDKKFLDICEELYIRIPKIEGNYWTWKNFKGTKLSKAYNSEKSILNNIKVAKAKNQPGIKGSSSEKLFEVEVGEEMFNLGKQHSDEAIDFANKVNKGNIGEIDYSSYKYIVEAKTNLDNLDAIKDLQTQMRRCLHKFADSEVNYLNSQNKVVVVVYKTGKLDRKRKESMEIVRQLEKDGVVFVDGIENLKKLY